MRRPSWMTMDRLTSAWSATARLATAALGGAALSLGLFAGAPAHAQQSAPRPVIGSVDWEAADADARALGIEGARPAQSPTVTAAVGGRANASGLRVPLLLPTSLIEAGRLGQLDEPLRLVAETFSYTAEAKAAPRSYLVQGTRYIFEVDEVEFDATAPVGEVYVERLEYGIEASFERYGVLYSVTIFCADPVGDEECAEEDTVRRLASEMALVP